MYRVPVTALSRQRLSRTGNTSRVLLIEHPGDHAVQHQHRADFRIAQRREFPRARSRLLFRQSSACSRIRSRSSATSCPARALLLAAPDTLALDLVGVELPSTCPLGLRISAAGISQAITSPQASRVTGTDAVLAIAPDRAAAFRAAKCRHVGSRSSRGFGRVARRFVPPGTPHSTWSVRQAWARPKRTN